VGKLQVPASTIQFCWWGLPIQAENNRQTNGMTTPAENQVSNGAVEEEEEDAISPNPPNSDEGETREQAVENAREEGMTSVMQQVLDEVAA
jgi:hypothetical protein